jgi:hypothetical protein
MAKRAGSLLEIWSIRGSNDLISSVAQKEQRVGTQQTARRPELLTKIEQAFGSP